MTGQNHGLALEAKTIGDINISPLTGDTYQLVFLDDFDGDALDETVWTARTQNANSSEAQVNLVENISVENSNLIITGKVENVSCYDSHMGRGYEKAYTGGLINTMGKKSFLYGRIEAYLKLPYGKGIWPAFWMIGDSEQNGSKAWWPWGGEIDIMEMFGKSDTETVVSGGIFYYPPQDYENFDYSKAMSKGRAEGCLHTPAPKEQYSDAYHLYGIEWTTEKLLFYIDDAQVGEIDITGYDMSFAMHNPQILILNFAMEGFGLVPGTTTGERRYDGRQPDVNGIWPKKFYADWVKVWQKKA